MPKIDLCFQGWLRGADVENVTETVTGKVLDANNILPSELIDGLNDGTYSIALGDHLYASDDAEIEVFDFEDTE